MVGVRRGIRVVSALGALCIVGALLLLANSSLVEDALGGMGIRSESLVDRAKSSFSTGDKNLLGRVTEASGAIADVVQSPLFGYGLGSIRPSYYSVYRSAHYSNEWNKYYVHNSYLDIWLQAGGIGLAMFLGLIWSSVVRVCKARRTILLAAKVNVAQKSGPIPPFSIGQAQATQLGHLRYPAGQFPLILLAISSALVTVWIINLVLAIIWPDLLVEYSSLLTLGIWIAASEACSRLSISQTGRIGLPTLVFARRPQMAN